MRILHLMENEKITRDIIELISNTADKHSHYFAIRHNKKTNIRNAEMIQNNSNVFLFSDSFDGFLKLIRRTRKIDATVAHGTFWRLKFCLFWLLIPSIRKKSAWVVWGGDILGNRDVSNRSKEKFKKFFLKLALEKFFLIGTPVKGDYELILRDIKSKPAWSIVRYLDTSIFLAPRNRIDDGITRILLGNSATKTNQHIQAMHILERFKDERIEIIAPLSYGDKGYASFVAEEGKRIFGNKFIPLESFMEKDEYYSLLGNIDIGFFNNNRQQAFGNIHMLMNSEAKIFLRKDTPMWEYFNTNGASVFSIEDIENSNFSEFKKSCENSIENNKLYLNKIGSKNNLVKEWDSFFNYLDKEIGND